eukprot:7168174-Prymnesium_polylepis.1
MVWVTDSLRYFPSKKCFPYAIFCPTVALFGFWVRPWLACEYLSFTITYRAGSRMDGSAAGGEH